MIKLLSYTVIVKGHIKNRVFIQYMLLEIIKEHFSNMCVFFFQWEFISRKEIRDLNTEFEERIFS